MQLGAGAAYDTFWEAPITVNPWDVPLEDKDRAAAWQRPTTMQKNKAVLFATAGRELQLRVEVSGDLRGVVHRAGLLLHDLRLQRDGARARAR